MKPLSRADVQRDKQNRANKQKAMDQKKADSLVKLINCYIGRDLDKLSDHETMYTEGIGATDGVLACLREMYPDYTFDIPVCRRDGSNPYQLKIRNKPETDATRVKRAVKAHMDRHGTDEKTTLKLTLENPNTALIDELRAEYPGHKFTFNGERLTITKHITRNPNPFNFARFIRCRFSATLVKAVMNDKADDWIKQQLKKTPLNWVTGLDLAEERRLLAHYWETQGEDG